jgi:hypothetical protein
MWIGLPKEVKAQGRSSMKHTTQTHEHTEETWYGLVAEQLQALTHTFGSEQASVHLYQAYEMICRDSLALHPGSPATWSSTLNRDSRPVQFALALGRPDPIFSNKAEFIENRLRSLSAPLGLRGDFSSLAAFIDRIATPSSDSAAFDRGGTFWIGASFARGGKSGLRIYINGKNGTENEQWGRMQTFAAHFDGSQEFEELLAEKMAPVGVSISLTQDHGLTGSAYFSGHEDRDHQMQSAVFSVDFGENQKVHSGIKPEFCGHCLFQSDRRSRERCLRWLALQKIDARAYIELLEVIAGQTAPSEVRGRIHLGLGWKPQPAASNPDYMNRDSAYKSTSR